MNLNIVINTGSPTPIYKQITDQVRLAVQYGYYAVICLAIVMLEVALILVVALNHNAFVAGFSAAAELFMLWSTWWAIKRYRLLKHRFAG